jgi:hypothetical protein
MSEEDMEEAVVTEEVAGGIVVVGGGGGGCDLGDRRRVCRYAFFYACLDFIEVCRRSSPLGPIIYWAQKAHMICCTVLRKFNYSKGWPESVFETWALVISLLLDF